jgi:hypothetical protein
VQQQQQGTPAALAALLLPGTVPHTPHHATAAAALCQILGVLAAAAAAALAAVQQALPASNQPAAADLDGKLQHQQAGTARCYASACADCCQVLLLLHRLLAAAPCRVLLLLLLSCASFQNYLRMASC